MINENDFRLNGFEIEWCNVWFRGVHWELLTGTFFNKLPWHAIRSKKSLSDAPRFSKKGKSQLKAFNAQDHIEQTYLPTFHFQVYIFYLNGMAALHWMASFRVHCQDFLFRSWIQLAKNTSNLWRHWKAIQILNMKILNEHDNKSMVSKRNVAIQCLH